MPDNQHDPLIIYTSKNGRTGTTVDPIPKGIVVGGSNALVRTVTVVRIMAHRNGSGPL